MTYCLALQLDAGLVLLADSRTNAGIDNISTYCKLTTWSIPAEAATDGGRAIALMTAGNLSITQEVVSLIEEEIDLNGGDQNGGLVTILNAPSMFRAAERVGQIMADVQARRGPPLAAAGVSSAASLILAGRIGAEPSESFLIYQPGNFIEATPDTPYLQIGELKYGKPILDRVVTPATTIEDGVTAALLSMDATIRSNLSVGPPLDLAVLRTGAPDFTRRRIDGDDPTWSSLSQAWGAHLRAGFSAMPRLEI